MTDVRWYAITWRRGTALGIASHRAALSLALALNVVSLAAQSSELSSDLQESLYQLAHVQTGLPLPARPPSIHLTRQEDMSLLIGCGQCTPSGVQVKEHVYVDAGLDFSKAYDASILLHELVHYLQWSVAGPAKSCDEWREREQKAIAVQTRYLATAGADTMRVRLSAQTLLMACKDAQWSASGQAVSAPPGGQ